MDDRFVAMDAFLDTFRKSHLEQAKFRHDANMPKFNSVKDFVSFLMSGNDDREDGFVHGIRLGFRGSRESVDRKILETWFTNALANMQKLHKAICMKIVNEYNSDEDTPWAWNERPFGKIDLSKVEREILSEGAYISIYKNHTTMECAFTDGPHNIYGGHSLVITDKIPSDTFDKNGKWIGDAKNIDFSIEG